MTGKALEGQAWIEGAQEAQDENLRALAALRPQGALGKTIHWLVMALHRYEQTIIHVDTGASKSSRLAKFAEAELRGEVYTNPQAINPRSGQPAISYQPFEFGRGGTHDSPGRTVREAGPRAIAEAVARFDVEFKKVVIR